MCVCSACDVVCVLFHIIIQMDSLDIAMLT